MVFEDSAPRVSFYLFWWYRSTLIHVCIHLFSRVSVETIDYKSNKKYTISITEHDYIKLYLLQKFGTSQNQNMMWSPTYIIYVGLIWEMQDWFIIHAQLYVNMSNIKPQQRNMRVTYATGVWWGMACVVAQER
jgi:hypothetical protein